MISGLEEQGFLVPETPFPLGSMASWIFVTRGLVLLSARLHWLGKLPCQLYASRPTRDNAKSLTGIARDFGPELVLDLRRKMAL